MNNDSAIEFYKGFGFEVVKTYPYYYKRIEPADAHILEKTFKRSAHNATNGGSAPSQPQVNGIDKGSK